MIDVTASTGRINPGFLGGWQSGAKWWWALEPAKAGRWSKRLAPSSSTFFQ